MRDNPSDDAVMMEFAANDVAFVPPLETGSVPEIVARVVVATQVGTPAYSARTNPFVPTPKKVEVAIATTFPVEPVLLTRTELAPIWAS